MKKFGYFVLILAVVCLIGMVSAEVTTIADNDGNGNAYSTTIAFTDDGELAISGVLVTGADTATVTSGGDDTGLLTSAGNAAVVTGADTFVAGSTATEVGGSIASTSLVASGDADVTEAQGATTSSVIGGSAAGQASVVSADSVEATTIAVAEDGAEAGTTVSAANMDGTIVQGAVGIGLAAAGQRVRTAGSDQDLYAETWAGAGSNYAETTTVAELDTGMILVYQGAIADPTLLGGFAAAGQYAQYSGTGFVGSFTDAEGANTEAEANIIAHTDAGNTMTGAQLQVGATNSDGSIAAQTGIIGAFTGTVNVKAETEAEVEGSEAETEAEAGLRGYAIEFGQDSGATAAGEVGSAQDTRFTGIGFVATEAENADGTEVGAFAGSRDDVGYVQTIQMAGADNTDAAVSQVGTVRTPSGTGMMETWAENGNFPGNYASVAVGVEDGQIYAGQDAQINYQNVPGSAFAQQTVAVTGPGGVGNAGYAWTENEAGDAFGNYAAVGTRVEDGSLIVAMQEPSYAYAGAGYIEANEIEATLGFGASTTQWASARSFHDRDRDRESYTGIGTSEAEAHSHVFGHAFAIVI